MKTFTRDIFKLRPLDHQWEELRQRWNREAWGILWEQGTGKTKLIIDSAALLHAAGEIQSVLVVAPSDGDVHRNWIKREIPKHLPDWTARSIAYYTSSPRKAEREQLERVMRSKDHSLRILSINGEALLGDKGYDTAELFMRAFSPCLMVIDESNRVMKNPATKRTKAISSLRRDSSLRRILTGTAITQSPADAWSQFMFLDSSIFSPSYYAFRAHYCEMLPAHHPLVRNIMAKNPRLRATPQVQAHTPDGRPIYKNLDELSQILSQWSSRVEKRDCLDLPEKVYQSYTVTLSKNQSEVYRQLDRELMAVIGETTVVTPLVITKMMKLQEVLGGFLHVDGNVQWLEKELTAVPRYRVLLELLEEEIAPQARVVIWARFVPEVKALAGLLREKFGQHSVVEFHGEIKKDARSAAIDSFQDTSSPVRFFIGQTATGGIGNTLTAASYVVFFSNDFSYDHRIQAEDRVHRYGLSHPVTYIDLEVEGALDSKILSALQNKEDVATAVMSNMKGTRA